MTNPIDGFTINGVAWDSPYAAGSYTLGWTNASGGAWDGGYIVFGNEGRPSLLDQLADTSGDGYTDGTNTADIDSSAGPLRIVIGLWPLGGDDWDFVSYGADVTAAVIDHLFGLGPVTIRGLGLDDWRASFFHDAPAPGLPELIVEAAFTGVWSDSDSWTDITNYVRSFTTKRGRSNLFETFQAGSATLLLSNGDRRFDPDYTEGPYYNNLLINAPVRIRASFDSTDYTVFYGYANEWTQSYDRSDHDATCTLTLSDAFKIYSHVEMPGSFYRLFVLGGIGAPPDHWYHLTEAPGELGIIQDDGHAASFYDGHNYGTSPGADSLVRYNAGKSTAFNRSSIITLPDEVADFSSGYTVAFWFKRNGPPGGSEAEVLLSLGDSFTGRVQVAMLSPGAGNEGKIQVLTNGGGTSVRSPTSLADNRPHMLVFTYDGNTTETLLIDGVQVDQQTDRTPYTVANGACAIGADPSGSLGHFLGSIAEVAIYSTPSGAEDAYLAGVTGLPGHPTTDFASVLSSAATSGALSDEIGTSGDAGVTCIPGPYVDGSALDMLQALAVTEQGQCYGNLNGGITFRTRHYHLLDTRSKTPQVRFNDHPDPGDVPYTDVTVNFDDTRLFNYASVTRQGGSETIYRDGESVTTYGRWTYKPQGTLLYASDVQSLGLGNYVVLHNSALQARVEAITVNGRTSSDCMTNCLAREIGDRVVAIRLPQGTGSAIERELILEGVEHTYKPGDWRTTYRLSPAIVEDAWILEDLTFGVLDATTALAF